MASSNVPLALSSFVGRQRELAEVTQLLASARLVTLTGPGGCGKTRLAQQVAGKIGARFSVSTAGRKSFAGRLRMG